MAAKILKCPKCKSKKIKTLNDELRQVALSNTVTLDAECENCGEKFQYNAITSRGKMNPFLMLSVKIAEKNSNTTQ